jgi:nitrite reductase/ring-hydroxylating ferredoxin subunit
MDRKDFLVKACTACLSATAIASVLSSCSATHFIAGNTTKDGLIISKDDFAVRRKGTPAYRSFIIVRNDILQYPIYVYRFSDQEYSALWMRCTHQGTELQASGDSLQCPAHGSAFNNKGLATNGPASSSLLVFPVQVTNKEIFIDLRKQS